MQGGSKECASRRQRGVTLPARPMSTSPSPAAHAAAHARAATADDAACSQDLEEVVAAGLQTCSANVCMTHMRTAARSHTHHANAGLTTGRAAFAETPAKGHSRFCDLFHAAQASCKQRQMPCHPCIPMQLLCTRQCSCEPPTRQCKCTQQALEMHGTTSSVQRRQSTERATAARVTAVAASR